MELGHTVGPVEESPCVVDLRAPWQARERGAVSVSSLLHSFWVGSNEGGLGTCTCAV